MSWLGSLMASGGGGAATAEGATAAGLEGAAAGGTVAELAKAAEYNAALSKMVEGGMGNTGNAIASLPAGTAVNPAVGNAVPAWIGSEKGLYNSLGAVQPSLAQAPTKSIYSSLYKYALPIYSKIDSEAQIPYLPQPQLPPLPDTNSQKRKRDGYPASQTYSDVYRQYGGY